MKWLLPSFIVKIFEGMSNEKDKENNEKSNNQFNVFPKVSGYFNENSERSAYSNLVDKKVGSMEFTFNNSDIFKSSLKESKSFNSIPTRKLDILTYQEILNLKKKNKFSRKFRSQANKNVIPGKQSNISTFRNVFIDGKNEIESTNAQKKKLEKLSNFDSVLSGKYFHKFEMNIGDKSHDCGNFYRSPCQSKKFTSFYKAVEPISERNYKICDASLKNKLKTDNSFVHHFENSCEKIEYSETINRSLKTYSKISPSMPKPKSEENSSCDQNIKINKKDLLKVVKAIRNCESKEMVKLLERCMQHLSNDIPKFSDDLKDYEEKKVSSFTRSDLKTKPDQNAAVSVKNKQMFQKFVTSECNSNEKCKCKKSIKFIRSNRLSKEEYRTKECLAETSQKYRAKANPLCTESSSSEKQDRIVSETVSSKDRHNILSNGEKDSNFEIIKYKNNSYEYKLLNEENKSYKVESWKKNKSCLKDKNNILSNDSNFEVQSCKKYAHGFSKNFKNSKERPQEYIFPGVTKSDVDREINENYVNFCLNSQKYSFKKTNSQNLSSSWLNYQSPKKQSDLQQVCNDDILDVNEVCSEKVNGKKFRLRENLEQNKIIENDKRKSKSDYLKQNLSVSSCNESGLSEPHNVPSENFIQNIINNTNSNLYFPYTSATDDISLSSTIKMNKNKTKELDEELVHFLHMKNTDYNCTEKEKVDSTASFSLQRTKRKEESFTLQRFDASSVEKFSKNKVQKDTQNLNKTINEPLEKKECFGESLITIYQRPESFHSTDDSLKIDNKNIANTSNNDNISNNSIEMESASVKNYYESKVFESYLSGQEATKYNNNISYNNLHSDSTNPRETDTDSYGNFNKNNFTFNNQNESVKKSKCSDCFCSNKQIESNRNYNEENSEQILSRNQYELAFDPNVGSSEASLSEQNTQQTKIEINKVSSLNSKLKIPQGSEIRMKNNYSRFGTNFMRNSKNISHANSTTTSRKESNNSDVSLLDISSSIVHNNASKQGESSELLEKDAGRGTKRLHDSTSQFENEERKEKRRRKTPYYICEKTKNSIILRRPIIIKSDDVSKLTLSENHRRTGDVQHSNTSRCGRVSGTEKRANNWRKARGREILSSQTSNFIRSFSYNFSQNPKSLSDMMEPEDSDDTRQNEKNDKYEKM